MDYLIPMLVGLFLLSLITILLNNHILLRHADDRLDKANSMVLTLAHSADSLADSIKELKDMMVHLETIYTARNNQLQKNRDDFAEAYTKLLHRYEDLESRLLNKDEQLYNEVFKVVSDIAKQPTINNNPAHK